MKNFYPDIKATVKLAIPISIAQLGHVMMGVVDSLMVGKVGTDSLAAASLVNGLFFLVLVLGLGMTSAISPLIAIAVGEEKENECGVIMNQAFIVNIIFALILLCLLLIVAELILFLDQPQNVALLARSYLQIQAFSAIPFLVFQVYKQFCESVGSVIPPMIMAIVANISNAFFNWVLIFGKLGFEPMGLDGAGYSTLMNRSFMSIAIFIFVMKNPSFKKYDLHIRLKNRSMKIIKKLVNLGVPGGFQYFLEVSSFSFAAIMIGWIGSKELAAHQIALNLASVTYMIILGIAAAGTIRVANAYGKRNTDMIRRAGFTALVLAATVMIIFGISFIILRNFLPTLYINNNEVLSLAGNLIIIAAMFQIFDGLQASGIAVLKGLTDVKIPMIFSFISYWIISIPIAALLGFYFMLGVIGIWVGLSLGLASVAVFSVVRFNRLSKTVTEEISK